jgi:hypothetical protein
MVRAVAYIDSHLMRQLDTMCILEAIAQINYQKEVEEDGELWLTLHSMITTLCILEKMGFKRVQVEVL